MKRMLVIVNPNAGRGQIKPRLCEVLDTFTKAGFWTEVYITQKPGEAKTVAKTRGGAVDRVVCCGGDGTLDEVVNGLMLLPQSRRPVLGYIPVGTTNDFAHSLGISFDPLAAADIAVNGKIFAVDIGQINDVYFSYTVGFGVFTNVSYSTDQDLKKLLGPQAYIMEGARELPNMKAHHVKVYMNGQVYEGDYLLGMVSNSFRVAGMTGLWGPDIEMDDGLFEVNLLSQPKDIPGWGDLAAAFLLTHDNSEYITRVKTSEVRFEAEHALEWVQDGEYGGKMADVTIKVLPHALRVVKSY